jgi:hypothetical protein
MKSEPVIVTTVPPVVGTIGGTMLVTVGMMASLGWRRRTAP